MRDACDSASRLLLLLLLCHLLHEGHQLLLQPGTPPCIQQLFALHAQLNALLMRQAVGRMPRTIFPNLLQLSLFMLLLLLLLSAAAITACCVTPDAIGSCCCCCCGCTCYWMMNASCNRTAAIIIVRCIICRSWCCIMTTQRPACVCHAEETKRTIHCQKGLADALLRLSLTIY